MRLKFEQFVDKIYDFLNGYYEPDQMKLISLQPLFKRLSRNKPLFTLSYLIQVLQVISSNMISHASKLS